jgi:hypothetical protein
MAAKAQSDPKAGASPKAFRRPLFVLGMAAIVVGYVLLSVNNITVAPVLLVLGYCVLVPLAFL